MHAIRGAGQKHPVCRVHIYVGYLPPPNKVVIRGGPSWKPPLPNLPGVFFPKKGAHTTLGAKQRTNFSPNRGESSFIKAFSHP